MTGKQSSAGVGYSVVESGGVRHIFAAAVPQHGETLDQQAANALRAISTVVDQQAQGGSIVHQAVFLREHAHLDACRTVINEFYGPRNLPATTYILQPPCDGKLLSIEAMGIAGGSSDVSIERVGPHMVVTRHDGITWVHLANVASRVPCRGVYDQATHLFGAMKDVLSLRQIGFEQVIRTWLYLGDIVGHEDETERYQELNRARTDFYQDIRFGGGLVAERFDRPVYPASTGIGAQGRDLVMSCIALGSQRPDVRLLPLENPRQTSSCDYGLRYGPQSPKFARAMAVIGPKHVTTFISGTASITASETRHCQDVGGQTNQTLDNIGALISEANFAEHGSPGCGAELSDLALVRVYLKRPEDYQQTLAICQSRLGEVPAIYAVADVCRPDLLVEIEGIAFSERR